MRVIGQALSERFGQSFIIENRPGAAGNLATEALVRLPADGYTLGIITTINAINATLYEKLNFDVKGAAGENARLRTSSVAMRPVIADATVAAARRSDGTAAPHQGTRRQRLLLGPIP
jgi:hypothetical protein